MLSKKIIPFWILNGLIIINFMFSNAAEINFAGENINIPNNLYQSEPENISREVKLSTTIDLACGTYSEFQTMGNITTMIYRLEISNLIMGGSVDFLNHKQVFYDFNSTNDADFDGIVNFLTDGVDEEISMKCITERNNDGKLGTVFVNNFESFALKRNPDLKGEEIVFIRLNYEKIEFFENSVENHVQWEIWSYVESDDNLIDYNGKLASIQMTTLLTSSVVVDYIKIYLAFISTPMGDFGPRIGWNITHVPELTGTIQFNTDNEFEFFEFVQILTNGLDNTIYSVVEIHENSSQTSVLESSLNYANPDFKNGNIEFIKLNILESNRPGDNSLSLVIEWEIWGSVLTTDSTKPLINSPDDLRYTVNSIGNYINWITIELYPNYFTVLMDGQPFILKQDWLEEEIIINVDGLEIGIYNITISVYDRSDNFASDTVVVEVIDLEPTPVNSTISSTNESSTVPRLLNFNYTIFLVSILALIPLKRKYN